MICNTIGTSNFACFYRKQTKIIYYESKKYGKKHNTQTKEIIYKKYNV